MKWWIVILVMCVGCSNDTSEYKNSKVHEADLELLKFYSQRVGRTQKIIRKELSDRGKNSDSLFDKISRIGFNNQLDRFDRLIDLDSLEKDELIIEANKLLDCAIKENLDTTGLKKGLEILESVEKEDDLLMTATTFLTNAQFNYLNDLKTELKKIESDIWRADNVNYWIQENRNVIKRDSVYRANIFVFNEFGPNDDLIEKFLVNDSAIIGNELIVMPNSELQKKVSIFSQTEIPTPNPESDPYITRSKLEIKYEECAE